ncbi:LysR family transcriptional regulator [Pectobacterium brasiliense]|uniref:LysR family transcriptional regulator n=1 Tax=Pectobacterium TaxID=122277 RepID=UPI0015DEBFDE|nr:LysR family transcriptional regulator [Pectobacterium brasiliense]MBA0212492.1 LysR family transcriptional regulator [Pectobacterium brasiliense]MBN3161345.1 LysR family transcriptional regulator [Pectobacterium brasiliense]MDY4366576.1 LysR family transcriptional regulator [Pectobacterium brasiliense]MDY7056107.1 LysR family transcriptional regulator [Pectobacterium brasiliense]
MDRFVAMQVFVDVVELGSLTAAANKLDISRAMATRYIASLEKAFGVRLLHRSSRSLGLTSAGSEILSYCRQILALNDDIGAALESKSQEPNGLIRVASSISFGQSYLADALRRYSAQYPKVSIEMVLKDASVNLVEQRIDLAIHVGDKLDPTVISRQLSRCASVVCAAPDYLARNGTPQRPDDLRQHNCLYHTRFGRVWRFQAPSADGVDLVMDDVGVTGNFAANDSMVLLHAALAGEGIVHLPAFTTAPYLRTGALVRVLTDYALPELGVYALYCSRKYLPTSTRTLLDFLLNDLSSG